MPHSKELIDQILTKVAADYPQADGYNYVIEQAITGTRMFPDIVVMIGEDIVCAVEIGYTRPEKLTAYRQQLKIPDVRWYDKSGVLHGDVEERSVLVKTSIEPDGDVFTYLIHNSVGCSSCEGSEAGRRVPEKAAERYIRRFGDEAYERRQDEAFEEERDDVETLLITDYVKLWLPSYCDKCGRTWMANDDDDNEIDVISIIDSIASVNPRELSREWGKRIQASWHRARECVKDDFDLSLNYSDGDWINKDHHASAHAKLHMERVVDRC
jgi:hypothetical protein